MAHTAPAYRTLDDIQRRKDELSETLQGHRERIGSLWYGLFTPKKATTRGEVVASVIGNCITAFDAFMLARKLMAQYGHLFRRGEPRRKRK